MKIQKWGNSLGLRIPAALAQQINLTEGTEVTLTIESNQALLVKPIETEPTLEELLAMITPDNRHEELELAVVGNELF
ncbi:AbrB/MazE/SpoVT family DNA-binding domain-containing protein [Bhargavaea cecembensis]|uniref:AbrB/MazE/SpoVT family DNA-binding domain-containing protein n=1 Tax=Bhargavaea cecembensis TaxID=394098 RepID=UPI000A93576E|nr:AbrB/MazE/SpoVT family DNA-binding domain-containing protein [Bhargavaea cecembensis]